MVAVLIRAGLMFYVGATACRHLGADGLAIVCAVWLLMPYTYERPKAPQ